MSIQPIKPQKKHIDKIDINDALIKTIKEKSEKVISLIQKNIEKHKEELQTWKDKLKKLNSI